MKNNNRWHGLSQEDMYALSQYNSEVGRGIVHTPEWDKRMAELQEIFRVNTLAEVRR